MLESAGPEDQGDMSCFLKILKLGQNWPQNFRVPTAGQQRSQEPGTHS